MKRIIQLLFVGGLLFIMLSVVQAQPPEVQDNGLSPQESVSTFLHNCSSGDLLHIATLVQGADGKAPALATITKRIHESFGKFDLGATDFDFTLDPQNPNVITVDFTVILRDEMGHRLAQRDNAVLNKYEDTGYSYWQIVPGKPEEYYGFRPVKLPPEKCGLTRQLATEIAYPEMIQHVDLSQSLSQLKQLGLGLMQLCMDYDQVFQLDPQHLKRDLFPYLQTEAIFTAPDDAAGTVSYQINPGIIGKNIRDIKHVETIVALYLGKDQKLDFRYDGKAAVCFLDGHVKAITPEEAKDLRWKP